MKKYLLGCAAVVFAAGTASATDMPAKARTQIYQPTPAYSWSGFYGGISGGYAWGNNDIVDRILGTTLIPLNFKPAGGFGGVQLGYNSQFAPHWLLGGEIDSSWGDLSDSLSGLVGPVGAYGGRNKVDYFGSARTRFGYVQDRNLFYVTGGVAWERNKYVDTQADALGSPGDYTIAKHYVVGWTIGGGWEYAIDSRWSFKLEYLYASFDNGVANDGSSNRRAFDNDLNLVRAGLNYRFDDGAAPAAMPVKAAAPRISSWSGGYLGVHGGGGWLDYRAQVNGTTWSFDPSGWLGGFQSGANWVFAPNWLFGLETDGSYGDLNQSKTLPGVPVSAKLTTLGTARARLGYIFDNVLVYGTGGAAYGREKATILNNGSNNESKQDLFGWAGGGGIEWMFAPQWSAKVEYIHADLGKNTFTNVPAGDFHSTAITVDTVKVGLNYYGPLIERFLGGK